jgi:hypothetical protein
VNYIAFVDNWILGNFIAADFSGLGLVFLIALLISLSLLRLDPNGCRRR